MKNAFNTVLLSVLMLTGLTFTVYAKASSQNYYVLKVYHYKTPQQAANLHSYLKNAYLPALHRYGIKQAGVFNTMDEDSTDKKVYVFIPFSSWDKIQQLDDKLNADKNYTTAAAQYINAIYNAAPYTRLEVIILKAFAGMPSPAVPSLDADKDSRIYELRSYESPTEKYHINKVDMFNAGDEISIFNKLGFNAVFYGQVLAGSHMPNLMYMTVHADKAQREEHWKTFGEDPAWKILSGKEEYKNNVSKIDVVFLKAAGYSDF